MLLMLLKGIQTLRNKREFRLARHGNMTRGKLNAMENTNPILIISDDIFGSRLINILPANLITGKYEEQSYNSYMYIISTCKRLSAKCYVSKNSNAHINNSTYI